MEGNYPALYALWIDAWNGADVELEAIFHRDVIVHQMPHERHGIEAVVAMIEQGRAPFDPVRFAIDVEPVFDDHMLAARWTCSGTYAGGLPNVTAEVGKQVVFSGIDMWRFSDGKVADYWVSSDTEWLKEQLGYDNAET